MSWPYSPKECPRCRFFERLDPPARGDAGYEIGHDGALPLLSRGGRGVSLHVDVPGRAPLRLDALLLDVNGTLGDRGRLLDGVAERIAALRARLEVHLLSADTFGTLAEISRALSAPARLAPSGAAKLEILRSLGPARCAAIGNGANDALLLGEAALGIAVVGPEGASAAALAACDVACRSIVEALDLLTDPRALAATLRG
jgi:soluble P-type ATPase